MRVYEALESEPEAAAEHLTKINLPATVSTHEGGASVGFRDGGYMEVETPVAATTESEGWTVTQLESGGTRFSKYGAASALIISYGK